MNTEPQVNPDEVKAFLANNDIKNNIDTSLPENTNKVNYDDILKAKEESEAEALETHNKVEESRSKLFEPDKASLTSLSSWAFEANDLKVETTEQDRSIYLKAVLNDTDLSLEVELAAGIKLQYRALTNYDFEVVFTALKKEADAGNINGPAQYASKVQQAAAALQLMNYAGKPVNYVKFSSVNKNIQADADILLAYIKNEMASWAWHKWQCVVTGLRIFEIKLSICNENMRNGNFWLPVGTA